MSFGLRIVAVAVVGLLLVGGPFASFAAAQAPTQPPPQGAMYPETPKSPEPETTEDQTGLAPEVYDVAVGVGTAVLIPGRIVTCALGTAVGLAALFTTFGTGYKFSMRIVEEGCGGKWVLQRTDLMPVTSPVTTTPAPQ